MTPRTITIVLLDLSSKGWQVGKLFLELWLNNDEGQWRVCANDTSTAAPIADFNYRDGNELFGRKLHELLLFVGMCLADSSITDLRMEVTPYSTAPNVRYYLNRLIAYRGSSGPAIWDAENTKVR